MRDSCSPARGACPPRGDAKEGWNNIDIFGWFGRPMQILTRVKCPKVADHGDRPMRRTIFFRNSVPFGGLKLPLLWCALILLGQPSSLISAGTLHETHDPGAAHDSHSIQTGSQHTSLTTSGWDGSPEGKAYSEFNHHLAGTFVMLIGLGELHGGLGASLFSWTRFFLPGALLAAGTYLVIWSDHDAWPIGPKSFTETYFGNDTGTFQHKAYALLLLLIGSIELLTRAGRLSPRYWSLPLPAFAIIGGLVLFLHSHSDHPSAHKIALHHATLGMTALMAGSCLIVSKYARATPAALGFWSQLPVRLKLAWGILVLIIGVQLLLYAE